MTFTKRVRSDPENTFRTATRRLRCFAGLGSARLLGSASGVEAYAAVQPCRPPSVARNGTGELYRGPVGTGRWAPVRGSPAGLGVEGDQFSQVAERRTVFLAAASPHPKHGRWGAVLHGLMAGAGRFLARTPIAITRVSSMPTAMNMSASVIADELIELFAIHRSSCGPNQCTEP